MFISQPFFYEGHAIFLYFSGYLPVPLAVVLLLINSVSDLYRIKSDPEPFGLVGSGSDLFLPVADPDPGWVKNQDPDTGSRSGMNIPDHISESLETIFGLKILEFFYADPGCGIFLTLDPRWKNAGQ